jgi:hypothetical protein
MIVSTRDAEHNMRGPDGSMRAAAQTGICSSGEGKKPLIPHD